MTTRFHETLALAGLPLIMEVKLQGPDGADLMGGRPVPEVVASYLAAGAPCLSVVTGRWFGGSPELLSEVRALTDLPLLRKDFITRQSQLDQTADLGGDAVLLTAQLLPVEGLRRLAEGALARGLTPFIEVVSAEEIHSISDLAAESIIAVNNKDIRTRERDAPDLDRSHRLLGDVLDQGCTLPVSASGIDTPEIAQWLLSLGYRGLLVGTALLDHGDLSQWSGLTPPAVRGAAVG